MPTYAKSSILSCVFAACLASAPTVHAQDFPPPNATVRAMAPLQHYEGVPDDIREVNRKALELGLITKEHHDRHIQMYEKWLPETPVLIEHSEALRKRLYHHLHPKSDPLIAMKRDKTGWWRYQDETNAYLGPEMATWCEPNAEDCTRPLAVSVLCDTTQVITCRTISQAVRMSEQLFLLYPYNSTDGQILATPDVILIYGKFPGQGRDHVLYAMGGATVSPESIALDYKNRPYGVSAQMGQPPEIVSMIYDNPEEMLQRIYYLLDIQDAP